jgi:hypothetical protein
VFFASVEVFCVLSHDDKINIFKSGFDAGKGSGGAEIGVEIQALAKGDIDAGEAFANGSGDGAFKSDFVFEDGFKYGLGKRGSVGFAEVAAGFTAIPGEGGTCSFEKLDCGVDHFGTDTVAGNKGDGDGGDTHGGTARVEKVKAWTPSLYQGGKGKGGGQPKNAVMARGGYD